MSSTKLVKVAVVGCGDVALSTYLPRLMSLQGKKIDLTAVCDIVEYRAKRAMHQFHAKEYYTDYDTMLEKADVEAVVNLTAAYAHAPLSLKALKAGKHVYTEKPMALTLDEADSLIREAEMRHVKLASAPPVVLNPLNRFVKDIINTGVIGRVCFVRAHSSHEGAGLHKHQYDPSWYYVKEKGGGPLYDMAVYALHTLTYILGPVKRVVAFSGLAIPERYVGYVSEEGIWVEKTVRSNVDDNTLILLDWGEATFGFVDGTYCVMASKGPSMEFYGSKGTINVGGEAQLEVYTEREDLGVRGWFKPLQPRRAPPAPERRWSIADGVEHFIDCILHDKKPEISGEHARHVLEIILKAYESAETESVQRLKTVF